MNASNPSSGYALNETSQASQNSTLQGRGLSVSKDARATRPRPLEYRFVSGLDRTYSKSVRAHVLSRHLTERRLNAQRRRKNKKQADDGDERASKGREAQGREPGSAGLPPYADAWEAPTIHGQEVARRVAKRSRSSDLQGLLGQGRIDPFQSLALPTNDTQDFLVDYYCGDILAPYGVTRDPGVLHPPRDMCMQIIASDEAAMHTLFAYTALFVYQRTGNAQYTTISLKHRLAATRVIKKRVLCGPAVCTDDGTMMAVIGLIAAVCETRPYGTSVEQEQEMASHLQGLQAMVAARGGLAPDLHSPTHYWLLFWIEICSNGTVFPFSTRLSEHAFARPSRLTEPTSVPAFWAPVEPIRHTVRDNAEELVGAYGNFYREARARSRARRSVRPARPSLAVAAFVLEPVRSGTMLHDLLSASSYMVIRPLIPTLYINIILWHYRQATLPAQLAADDLVQLQGIMHRLALARATETTIWALVTDPRTNGLHHPPSAWLLTRLLRVESRLSLHLREQLRRTLLEFLMRDDDQALECSWPTPAQFRSEVMTDLGLEDGADCSLGEENEI